MIQAKLADAIERYYDMADLRYGDVPTLRKRVCKQLSVNYRSRYAYDICVCKLRLAQHYLLARVFMHILPLDDQKRPTLMHVLLMTRITYTVKWQALAAVLNLNSK